MVYEKASDIIGNTPLLKLQGVMQDLHLEATILAKLEFLNPSGSVKDRAALKIIQDAEKSGALKAGGTIVEATSGNTGIGLASVAASRGYKVIIIMPDTMSVERIKLMKAYGAEVVLSDGSKGMAGSLEKLEELKQQHPNCFVADQFNNPSNAQAHYESTGPEIWEDTGGKIDAFIAGVGTGGTLTGTARYLKEKNGHINIVAVEPAASPLLTGGKAGPHGLQGIGANFIPSVLDQDIYDEVIGIEDDEAFQMTRLVGKSEGIMVGISAGAALAAAVKLARKAEMKGANIVVLFPDSGDRYLSGDLFEA